MEAPEKSTELEVKYQKLATEYSKVSVTPSAGQKSKSRSLKFTKSP